MKRLIKTTFYIWIILLTACGTKSAETKTSDSLSGESFNEFFDKFKSDSLFQIERVKFPWTIPSEDGESIVINKTEWQHADFAYSDNFATREIDAYTQKITTYGDTVKIELRGVDNGINIDFVFAKIDKKWFLYSEKDLSN
ncbi:MAG: DUF4348 domain-containing protein [Bacteroidetes bacterium]|nr:DUF4348 domain-containing protein [Bacteroidota bacterium]